MSSSRLASPLEVDDLPTAAPPSMVMIMKVLELGMA